MQRNWQHRIHKTTKNKTRTQRKHRQQYLEGRLYLTVMVNNRPKSTKRTTTTTTFILSITSPQRSRTITMRIKNIQLITIDCIDWRDKKRKKNNIPRGEIIKKRKSNNNIFSKCVKRDSKYSVSPKSYCIYN
jgi:hypothetical protein